VKGSSDKLRQRAGFRRSNQVRRSVDLSFSEPVAAETLPIHWM